MSSPRGVPSWQKSAEEPLFTISEYTRETEKAAGSFSYQATRTSLVAVVGGAGVEEGKGLSLGERKWDRGNKLDDGKHCLQGKHCLEGHLDAVTFRDWLRVVMYLSNDIQYARSFLSSFLGWCMYCLIDYDV